MWDLKYDTKELIYKKETDSQTQRTDLQLPSWGCGGREAQTGSLQSADTNYYIQNRLKTIYRTDNLYSPGNYIQYPVINHNEKDYEKEMCVYVYMCMCVVAQLCPTKELDNPTDCSPPDSVHGIFQARILDQEDIPFSRGSSQPRDQTWAFCIVDRFLTV